MLYLTFLLLTAALASAAAVPAPAYALPQPGGSPVKRAEATSPPVRLNGLPDNVNLVVSVALVTDTPVAKAIRADEVVSSACTPNSMCFDGYNACGTRFGGCFDQNFCGGTTSFPMPPACTKGPEDDLTQEFRKRMEEKAAVGAV